jgi:hypothetical protein
MHLARSIFFVARNMWYSPAVYLVLVRLFV